jgi:hypothetical protein
MQFIQKYCRYLHVLKLWIFLSPKICRKIKSELSPSVEGGDSPDNLITMDAHTLYFCVHFGQEVTKSDSNLQKIKFRSAIRKSEGIYDDWSL